MSDTNHRHSVNDVSEIQDRRETHSSHRHKFSSRREKVEWYLDEIDSYKEDMGKWYTVFIRRVLPFLIFFFPINNLAFAACEYVVKHFLGGVVSFTDTAFPHVVWLVATVIFLAILIFLPRFATFCEFAMAIAFYALVIIRLNQYNDYIAACQMNGIVPDQHIKPLITNPLGYFIAISLGIFIFMKFVFLVIEIIYMITFRGEKEARAYKEESDTDIVF